MDRTVPRGDSPGLVTTADSHGHAHSHPRVTGETDRRWLLASLSVILAFMVAEVTVGLLGGSLALLADAGHMLTDAAALGLAIVASRLAQRPAKGSYTYGFTRIDAVAAQANGIALLLLAVWFAVEAVRRLIHPGAVTGWPVVIVATIGIVVNVLAGWMAAQANRASLNVRGAVAHIVNDLWAFVATAIAGVVILVTGWDRADAIASLVVVALMVWAGWRLVTASGRVFLEAAPEGVSPGLIGQAMAAVDGVTEVHDLHIWDLGGSEPALSAHVVVDADHDCHVVAADVRAVLRSLRIVHATLQADHSHDDTVVDDQDCRPLGHGPGYSGIGVTQRSGIADLG